MSACVTSRPENLSNVDLPEKWKAETGGVQPLDVAALREWWKQFHDPVLDTLIQQGLKASPDMRTALARIQEAQASRRIEYSSLLPSISGGASDRIERRDARDGTGAQDSQNLGASLDISWETDLFGKQKQNLAAASRELQETIENYYAVQVSLTADIATAYISLRANEERLRVLRNNIQTRDETTQITRWKQEAGMSDMLELQQSVSTLEQAKAAIPALQLLISENKNQLALLCGQPPGALDKSLSRKFSLPKIPARIPTGIPATVLQNRPDVRGALYNVLAAYHRLNASELERLPNLNLGASISISQLRSGDLLSPETTAKSIVGSLIASLAQPIFEGGRITANIQMREAQLEQALANYEAVILQALVEVENSLVAIRRTGERITLIWKADTSASEAAALAHQQYEAGQVDLLVVLDTERTKLNIQEERVHTQANQLNAYIQLYKALGGGWKNL